MTRHTTKMKRFLLLLLPLLVIPFIGPSLCYANAAEPPVIIIIVPDAPDDLEISMEPDNIEAHRTDKVIESYYSFYKYDLQSLEYTIKGKTAEEQFDIILDIPPQKYDNVYTLNLEN